jgi:hypothetical protein
MPIKPVDGYQLRSVMKRLLLLIVLLALVGRPVQAQEECSIQLAKVIAQLVEAQSAADRGDTPAAVAGITAVRDRLDTLVRACAGAAGALPATLELNATLEFNDGLFRFNYPDGWTKVSPIPNVYALSNLQAAAESIVESNVGEAIPAGAQVVVAAYGDMRNLFGASSFEAAIEQAQSGSMANAARFVSPEAVVIQDYPGVRLEVSSDLFDGTAYLLDLQSDSRIFFFVALTPSGEYAAFEPTVDAILASIQIGPRTTGAETRPPVASAPKTGRPLSEITYRQPISIHDLIPDMGPQTPMLSPDGAAVAWFDRRENGAICLYRFARASTQCQPLPETFNSVAPVVLWSPDSRYVAFTQDGLRFFHEADIWLLDTQTLVYTNLTDDRINRLSLLSSSTVSPGDSTGPLWFDHSFTWGTDGFIYFIRLDMPDTTQNDTYTIGLYRIAPEGGEAELIRDFTDDFERFSIYQLPEYNLSGTLAISPDAGQIAFTVIEPQMNSLRNGVWVMPLSGSTAPRQLVTLADLTRATNPEFREAGGLLYPTGLAWTSDQTKLVVLAQNLAAQGIDADSILYHITLADGTLTPLTPFSDYTRAELTRPAANDRTPIYFMPRAAVMSPDGTAPMMLHMEMGGRTAGLSALAPGGSGWVELLTFDYRPVGGALGASSAADGRLLLLGYLFEPSP